MQHSPTLVSVEKKINVGDWHHFLLQLTSDAASICSWLSTTENTRHLRYWLQQVSQYIPT
jgi:hypothetical protein